jgi:hypothetical protein
MIFIISLFVFLITISYVFLHIEDFNDQENLNYYNYCVNNFNLRGCVPNDRCLNFGFNNLCS